MHTDTRAAAGDYLALRMGADIADPHPIAEQFRDDRTTLQELARHLTMTPAAAGLGELSRALASADFGEALSTGLNRLIAIGYGRQTRRYSSVLLDVPTRGLRPMQLPTLDLGELGEAPRVGGIPLALAVPAEGETIQPLTYAVLFMTARGLLLSDGVEVMGAIGNQLGGQSARLTPRLIGATLTNNANLSDGAPLIGADNTTSATGLDLSAVGEAMAILRNTTTAAGNVADARAAALLVPPAKEAAALTLVAAMSVTEPALSVLANPWAGSDSYLIADPEDLPTFARVYPAGIDPVPSVERVSPTRTRPDGSIEHCDGQCFEFIHYLGINAVGRGIVKIPAS